jgi:hypothetical protein
MTENGDPYENAVAERINGILKYDFLIIDGFNISKMQWQLYKSPLKFVMRKDLS